jgi:alkanesulfonate monooxygenase SsuD/methylene tetrahydromethanopterin reductase-like flavin-dependent oxidoreductase (luciferase family)
MLGQNAEQLGFDSYWVQDHPMGGRTAGRASRRSQAPPRLPLGSIVSCVYYRSPVLLARHAADVDRFSGGRLVLGIGFGDDEAEFRQMNGIDEGTRADMAHAVDPDFLSIVETDVAHL